MNKIIQKPRECRNAHCGAMCCPIQAEEMQTMWGGNSNKCPYYERRDDLYMDKAIPLDRIKQAREEIANINPVYSTIGDRIPVLKNCDDIKAEVLEILDRLIESEEVENGQRNNR